MRGQKSLQGAARGDLASSRLRVTSIDMTAYGRSTGPPPMADPCNFAKEQQTQFIPKLIPTPCAPTYPTAMTTMSSDWNDLAAVVDHLRALRRVEKVSLVAWSQGGPRTGGYVARNPDKVARLVVLAPAYNRAMPLEAPDPLPASNGPMTGAVASGFQGELGSSGRLS
jgi:pimeloyl-ACP methyl ester carboxylesterase